MQFVINFEKKHLWILAGVIAILGVGLVIGLQQDGIPWHPLQHVSTDEQGDVSVDANDNTIIDAADSVPWSGITGMPAGFADGNDDGGGGGSSLWSEGSGSKIYYNNGNVGIGINDPQSSLHVAGQTRAVHDMGDTSNGWQTPRCDCDTVNTGSADQDCKEGDVITSATLNVGDICYDQWRNIFGDHSDKYVVIGGTLVRIDGGIEINGKATVMGGVDPPYVSYSDESHESIRNFAKNVEEHEKVMQFWNKEAKRFEVYIIEEDKFYTLAGDLVQE